MGVELTLTLELSRIHECGLNFGQINILNCLGFDDYNGLAQFTHLYSSMELISILSTSIL